MIYKFHYISFRDIGRLRAIKVGRKDMIRIKIFSENTTLPFEEILLSII